MWQGNWIRTKDKVWWRTLSVEYLPPKVRIWEGLVRQSDRVSKAFLLVNILQLSFIRVFFFFVICLLVRRFVCLFVCVVAIWYHEDWLTGGNKSNNSKSWRNTEILNFLRNQPEVGQYAVTSVFFCLFVCLFFVFFFTCVPFTWSCWPMSSTQLFGRAPEREMKSDSGCNSLWCSRLLRSS